MRPAGVACLLAIISGLGGSCRGRPVAHTAKRYETSEPVTVATVSSDDRAMEDAIAQARATVERFVAALGGSCSDCSGFAIKVPFTDGDYTEHLWITEVRIEEGQFVGTVNNRPVAVTIVSLGDQVSIRSDAISDWMYVDSGRLVGGHTIRALRARLPVDQQREFDRQFSFVIE